MGGAMGGEGEIILHIALSIEQENDFQHL